MECLPVNMLDAASVDELARQVAGRVDIVVNNAGSLFYSHVYGGACWRSWVHAEGSTSLWQACRLAAAI